MKGGKEGREGGNGGRGGGEWNDKEKIMINPIITDNIHTCNLPPPHY